MSYPIYAREASEKNGFPNLFHGWACFLFAKSEALRGELTFFIQAN